MAYQPAALDALGDPARRAIFERLGERPGAVGMLAEALPISRPVVSQYLKVLKQAGLLTDRAVGNSRIYEVGPTGVQELRSYLDKFWNRALASFKEAVEAKEDHR